MKSLAISSLSMVAVASIVGCYPSRVAPEPSGRVRESGCCSLSIPAVKKMLEAVAPYKSRATLMGILGRVPCYENLLLVVCSPLPVYRE